MTVLHYTTSRLVAAGRDTQPLQRAFAAAFTHASTATTGTIQHFWNHFVDAHRKIYRGGAMQEAA